MSAVSTTAQGAKRWIRLHQPIGAINATTSDHVVLTFDDGPDPDLTPQLLSVLAAADATATFFVLMTRARPHADILRAVFDAGHEIGLHGVDHQPLTDFSFRAAVARTVRAKDELEALVGAPVRWFRPPYGSQSVTTLLATRQAGLTPVLWNATTWDWKDVSQAERLAKAKAGGRAGAILLAHDGTADSGDGADDEPPVDCDRPGLLAAVLEEYRSRGLTARSLGQALQDAEPLRTARVTRRRS